MKDALVLAYAAGVIDSDGYVGLYRKLGPQRRDGLRPTYYDAKIGCNQIDPTIPNLLRDTFGGAVHQFKPQTRTNGQPWFMWVVYSRQASGICVALAPYLRLKRRQAELVVEFYELTDRQAQRPGRALITPEMEAEREGVWRKIRHLNSPRNPRFRELLPLAPIEQTAP